MSRLAVGLIASLIGLLPAFCAEPERIVVMTYNIHHGAGLDGRLDVERIAAVIKSVSPDLVALQEVDRRTKRSGGADQAVELGCLTGMQWVYGRTLDFQGGYYGNAVLSRLLVQGYGNVPLPPTRDREPRAVLSVEVVTRRNTAFRFFATHLDTSEQDRAKAVPVLAALAEEKPGEPALLAGDLNATPGSEIMRQIKKTWRVAGDGMELLTFPAGKPDRQIDYILFRPAQRWKVIEVRVLDEPLASDHRPIVAVLELR